ncbi:MAG: SDR family NAD(P)-dependent oxidoreductase [bacterium]
MDPFSKEYGEWALVAGAAEGIGAAFCEALAARKMNLAMVDIRGAFLHETAERIGKSFGVQTRCLVQDLAEKEAWIECLKFLGLLDCRLLVYVPAYSPVKFFLKNSSEEIDRYIHLNSLTPLHLVHALTERMREKGSGGIILMSSLAGLIGPKFVAPYAATKAFNIVLAESLFHELRSSGIAITACCAGPTSTPTYWSSLPDNQKTTPDVMEPGRVAEYALQNLGKKAVCIPGRKNRFFYFILLRILPRPVASRLVSLEMGKMYNRED